MDVDGTGGESKTAGGGAATPTLTISTTNGHAGPTVNGDDDDVDAPNFGA